MNRRRVLKRNSWFSPRGPDLGSPLTGLSSKSGIEEFTSTVCAKNVKLHISNTQQTCEKQKPRQNPLNIYIGENFTVRLYDWFRFTSLIKDNKNGAIFQCDFRPLKKPMDMSLSAGALNILQVPNAGGSSIVSEVLSFEMLQRCFRAKLYKTEMEVSYFPEGGSITDYVCDMFNTKIGVSVTRAIKFHGEYVHDDAEHLLMKKLKGIVQSSRNSLEKWSKQILHVWSPNKHTANVITQVYNNLPDDVKSNTVVIVTTTQASNFIYKNR
ncbi:hypothetical protein CHS0354_004920 [Potamilus streckersoni]|uniref:Uncharacterized protein n=1 Tax=Potamilus streckersoni TaxID=2493646 RepID=A0AAE0TIY9_9BIVA|nr:hypothetical protein CHS0354_004920 [Potamilus streckersoni]